MTRPSLAPWTLGLGASLVALSLSGPVHAQATATNSGDGKSAAQQAGSDGKNTAPPAGGDAKAPDRPEAKSVDKKPQVRTYTSVTVVSDPTQIPRLPLPSRSTSEGRENVRALRQEIQEMRRSLRQDRPGVTDVRVGPGASPQDAPRRAPSAEKAPAGPNSGPGSPADKDPASRANGLGNRPALDGRQGPTSRPELDRRDPDTGRPRAIPRDPPGR